MKSPEQLNTYSEEQALEEAQIMREKVETGEAESYAEAEQQVESEQKAVARAKEIKEMKQLSSRYEDFCHRADDRMFTGEKNCPDNGDILPPEETDPSIDEWRDDEYFEKLLSHPAFKEKIDTCGVIVDIGNGGNLALRIDAEFLKRNGFNGKVIGVDPFRNENETNVSNSLHTEAIKIDGLSYLLEQPNESQNVLCSNMEREIIDSKKYAEALVKEIFRVVPEDGLFICIHSDALHDVAKGTFPFTYEIDDNAYSYIFTKKEVQMPKQDSPAI